MADKLTPVTSEAQLRPGVLVEIVCGYCSQRHRHLLLGRSKDHRQCAACGGFVCCWSVPLASHVGTGIVAELCPTRAIPERRLFIVDTGLDAKQDAIEEAVVQRQLKKIKLDI